jgi:hypothetical protein
MTITVDYPHNPVSGAPRPLPIETLWGVAAQVRRQVMAGRNGFAVPIAALVAASRRVTANGQAITVD